MEKIFLKKSTQNIKVHYIKYLSCVRIISIYLQLVGLFPNLLGCMIGFARCQSCALSFPSSVVVIRKSIRTALLESPSLCCVLNYRSSLFHEINCEIFLCVVGGCAGYVKICKWRSLILK